jgi:hypothetical protein
VCARSSGVLPRLLAVSFLLLGGCSSLHRSVPDEAASAGGGRTDGYEEGSARDAMYTLIRGDRRDAGAAVDEIIEKRDRRFIPVFIELLIADLLSIVRGVGLDTHLHALEALSGRNFGNDWASWVEWYGSTDLTPPPGFTGWKGDLYARIDPRFKEFLTEGADSTIRVEEILWGGVRVDGIPALDNPAMIGADEADYLDPGEPVFGISLRGDNRAYPLRILDWHEMVNDTVGGVPVSLAYCTLCGAGVAFDGRGPDGAVYTFGTSGFLYRSNKLMYDRKTHTLWNQLTGRPVLGDLVGKDLALRVLPLVVTTWERWREEHPDTLVLSLDTGFDRRYEPAAPYGDYFSSDETMFPVWKKSDILPPKSRVFALRVGGTAKAYPLDLLLEQGVVNDRVGETPVVLIAPGGEIHVEGTNIRKGPVVYSAGAEIRAYERREGFFSEMTDRSTLVDAHGDSWTVTEEALTGPGGARLDRLPGHLAYWFGWYAFFPHTLVYGK